MRNYDISELCDFMPLTEGGYAVVPRGQGIRIPYVSCPPLEKPWHGYRSDCQCPACRSAHPTRGVEGRLDTPTTGQSE